MMAKGLYALFVFHLAVQKASTLFVRARTMAQVDMCVVVISKNATSNSRPEECIKNNVLQINCANSVCFRKLEKYVSKK